MNKQTLFALILLLSTACNGKQSPIEPEPNQLKSGIVKLTENQQKQSGITTSKLELTLAPDVVHCNGQIDIPPDAKISVHVPVGGYVSEIDVLPGDCVKKGQVLATLIHPDYLTLQQEYLELHAQMLYHQSEWDRQKKLMAENAGVQRTLDKAEAEYLGSFSQLKAIEVRLRMLGIRADDVLAGKISEKIVLRSSINGYVGNVFVNKGKYAGPHDILLTLLGTDHMHVELQVFEKDIAKVKEKQRVEFTVAGSNSVYQADVKLIGKELNTETRSINVHAHISRHYPELIAGMYAHANIFVSADSAYVLPKSAVYNDGKRTLAWIEESQGVYRKIEINVGEEHNDIISFFPSNDQKSFRFVTSGAYYLFAEESKQSEE
ncbi:MAG: efflux RND transporter periplasmic adaptor subunit [Candidatus Competibacteraceae bacterium]|nr:efflux RND transporter periplasmic adaptor subunit [Candidatus Competibacteraceae bacterium]